MIIPVSKPAIPTVMIKASAEQQYQKDFLNLNLSYNLSSRLPWAA